jgi:hypothetical protein
MPIQDCVLGVGASGFHSRGQRERHRLGIAEADDQIRPALAEGKVPHEARYVRQP